MADRIVKRFLAAEDGLVAEWVTKRAAVMPRLMNVATAAAYLDLDTGEIRRRIELGHIPLSSPIPPATAWQVDREMIDSIRQGEFPELRIPGLTPGMGAASIARVISESEKLGAIKRKEESGSRVYFIGDGAAVKIGISTNTTKRLASLRTGSPRPLQLLALMPGGRGTESRIHEELSAFRIRGEWFRFEGPVREMVERNALL